jgi:hypothetical protein
MKASELHDILLGQPTGTDILVALATTLIDADERGILGGGTGKCDCPVCQCGSLAYRVHGNGHVWGKCTTPGCVQWMQ